ncbi:MAG: CPBP family intramembrane metalloprotease [Bacteroidetes bacterium]|nr:CPBP family intramembrane metalloprotease [Bacteroidota bacterium]MBU1486352.1 CPBP family intramembrane metalloprotease [Bacteroidota bacterium]MBU2377410.1 CPBP family intramembrane metalloprotease [Bacteroidota bacterium]
MKVLLFAYLFFFIIHIITTGVDFIILEKFKFSFFKIINEKQADASKDLNILFILVLLPILEEITFRLPLKINKINIFLSAIGFYFLFVVPIYSINKILILNELIKFLFFVTFIFCFCFYFLSNRYLKIISSRYYTFFFYFLSILFGFLHMTNFIDGVPDYLVFLAPIFTFHQVIAGISLGYIRIRNGLFWSIILHCIFNLPPAIYYFSQILRN